MLRFCELDVLFRRFLLVASARIKQQHSLLRARIKQRYSSQKIDSRGTPDPRVSKACCRPADRPPLRGSSLQVMVLIWFEHGFSLQTMALAWFSLVLAWFYNFRLQALV